MDKKEKLEKMAEMMRSCCTGEGDVGDGCSSMMRKMMKQEGKDEKKETEGSLKEGSGV
jgi:hypothetical protein